jgi:predicted exporter
MSRRTSLLMAWCVCIALGAGWTSWHFRVSADLRHFMPEPRTEAQRLLLQNIGESPASRLLVLAIGGDDAADLARISTRLVQSLARSGEVAFAANGGEDVRNFPESLLPYRYLLTDSFDSAPLDEQTLAAALQERASDLASPGASLLEEILPRDPTLEILHLAERWRPREEPGRTEDVWFTADARRALLLVETRAAAFDPDGQARAIARIRDGFDAARGDSRATLEITGSGYFSATIKERMQREAAVFGAVATCGLMVLMWIAYRRWLYLLLGALPLVSGGLAGVILVGSLFESVHGITLAFGFTLIGVAQDYPVHLFSHLRHDRTPEETARAIWRPLLTGVTSTCIAYLAFLASGVTGLAQLACLTVTGLAVAAACTRFLLPRLVASPREPVASSRLLLRMDSRLLRLPRMEWVALPILLVCAAMLYFARTPFWQNDLSRLTPVPVEALRLDAALRRELPTPDLRYLLVVGEASADLVLTRLEALDGKLHSLTRRHVIGGFEHAAQILPSAAVQRRRQQTLPAAEPLRAMIRSANQRAGFADDVFEPFVQDVQRARELPVLVPEQLMQTPLGSRVATLLFERGGAWHGIVSFHAIGDAAALARELGSEPGTTFLDLKQASEDQISAQRAHILRCLEIAAVALILVVLFALRSARRALRVLAPMALTTLVIVAVLRGAGVQLNLFHLISLVLAAGLGLDYALFFEHTGEEEHDQVRTLHALLVCAISTLLVFALLSFSSAPVLQAIGVTVSLGVVCNFLLSLALSRPRRIA